MPSGLTPEMLLPQFTNMTPEAASLGRYGAFQVSEYSGAANISIPLYTVNLSHDPTGLWEIQPNLVSALLPVGGTRI